MTTAPKPYARLDATALFGKKPTAKVAGMNVYLKLENGQKQRPMGEVKGLVFHWSAGTHEMAWDGYHGGVAQNDDTGEVAIVKCLDWNQLGQHAWMRNSAYWGLSFFAMAQAVWQLGRKVSYTGPQPITPAMLEALAVYAAEVCAWKRIDPRGTHQAPELKRVGDNLVPTGRTITLPNLLDHADLAERDGYAADRGDIGPYKAKLVQRLVEVYDELKANKRQFQFQELLK